MSPLDRMSNRPGARQRPVRPEHPKPETEAAETPTPATSEALPPPAASSPQAAERPVVLPSPVPDNRALVAAAQNEPPAFFEAKTQIHDMFVELYADDIDVTDRKGVRSRLVSVADDYLRGRSVAFNRLDYARLIESLLDDVLGLGPLQQLLDDPTITEVMINNPQQVFIERDGRLMLSSVTFENSAQLRRVIDRIVSAVGRRVDESSPMCDARLRDGSRVNVIIPPLAIDGPCMTIRKFGTHKFAAEDLIAQGSGTPDMFAYLQAAVRSKLNILVSGGTGSGKTTLLNILSASIPNDERLVTIEDAAELQLQQFHVIRLEARPPNVEGEGEVEIRDLVRNALRMRPDRIIVGECRGGEALDMLQAMSTGHEGSMSTVHANSPFDALARLETMVLMAGTDLPSRAILRQISSAIDVIVQVQRLRGGARRIVAIGEITGLKDQEVGYQELFEFRRLGVDETGAAIGYHTATGVKTCHAERFMASGEKLPETMFKPAQHHLVDAAG